MDVFLGLDLGTTNCKALAIGTDGETIASVSLPTPAILPSGEGGAIALEYDAEELWQTSLRLIRLLLEKLRARQNVAGVAVASMGEAGVLVNQAGSPLAPVMTWLTGVPSHPYLEGSGPPQRDPHAWGAWLGLRHDHTRGDLVRAVVEGASYAIRFRLEILQSSTSISGAELRCVGGATRNTFWQKIKADVIGMPIETPAIPDITAQGAALLAGIGTGAFTNEIDAAQKVYRSAVRYEVDPERSMFYNSEYQGVFKRLNALYQNTSLSRDESPHGDGYA